MKDITAKITHALSQDILWNVDLFFRYIQLLKEDKFEISYWEDEENWATIGIANQPIGYLWKKYPLLFIQETYLNRINKTRNSYPFLSVISVADLNAKILKLDYTSVRDYLDAGVDYDLFSASDLWFQNNSI